VDRACCYCHDDRTRDRDIDVQLHDERPEFAAAGRNYDDAVQRGVSRQRAALHAVFFFRVGAIHAHVDAEQEPEYFESGHY